MLKESKREELLNTFRAEQTRIQGHVRAIRADITSLSERCSDQADAAEQETERDERLMELQLEKQKLARVESVLTDLSGGWDATCECGVSVVPRLMIGEPTHQCVSCKEKKEMDERQFNNGRARVGAIVG